MRSLLLYFGTTLATIVSLCGCDDSSTSPSISAHIGGLVHIDGPVANAELTLISIFARDGGELVLSEGMTAEDGTFSLETQGARGPFKLVVMPPGRGDALVHFVPQLEDFKAITAADVVVTPVTAISSALTDYYFTTEAQLAEESGMSLDQRAAFQDAYTTANALIDEHFFGAPHNDIRPQRLSLNESPELDVPPTLAGLSLDGLTELGRLMAQREGVGLEGIFTTTIITNALVEDIQHDGVFDGRGHLGAVLALTQPLDSHTLRRDYALALLRFIESERDISRFGRADIRRFADNCANSQAVIFPPDIVSQLETDPPLVSITPKDGSVVSGTVFAEFTSTDIHRIDRVEQSAAPGDFPWRPVEGPDDELNEEEALWYRYDYRFADTTARPDGTYTVTVISVDELDNVAREEVRWIVDNTPPEVTIEAPADGTILSGESREVFVRAIDINGLASFSVTTPDGVVHAADIPEPGEDVISPTEAELRIDYNSLREVDGLYEIVAVAEDVVRNRTEESIEVQVDNAAPTIVFRSPRNTDVVDGLVSIIVEAQDAAPIDSFVVTTPDQVEHVIERSADGEWRADFEWDSTTVRDGAGYPITATVVDNQGNSAPVTITVEVNNVDEGIAAGVAHFDSPVAGLVVQAWTISADPERVDLCEQTREGQCVTAEDGSFEIEIADNYIGPLMLTAIADQNAFAEYIDAATGEVAGINDFDLRTLIVNYQPGVRHEGLVFSAASTLTTDWLLATLQPDGDIAAQARASIIAWGQHLCPVGINEDPCDPTTTRPQRYDGTDEEFVAQSSGALLGLVQAGLARRAADLRMRFDEPPFWAVGLLKRFRRDMEDGVIDGKRGEELIKVDNHPRDHRYIGACSLRSGLAAGMGSFLNKTRLLDVDVAARNQTEIEKIQMVVHLEGLSTRVNRDIWGPLFIGGRLVWDYCEFDGVGPEIIITQPQDGDRFGPNGGQDTADWTMRIRARAEDSSGLGEMWLTFADRVGDAAFEVLNPSPTNFITEFFYEGLDEGEIAITASVADLAGNLGSLTVTPIIDLTPPEVQVVTTSIDRFDPLTGEVIYRLDEPVETSEDNPILTAARSIVLGIISDEPITISGTDAADIRQSIVGFHYFVTFNLNPGIDRLALEVGDLQGNTTRQDIWVLRDDEGPSIELVNSGRYQPEDTLDWRDADCPVPENCRAIRFDFDENVQIPPAELQLGQRAVPHSFVKFHQNWDGDITGRANQPTLNFQWEDELGEGVDVDYRVLTGQVAGEGICCTNVRFEPLGDWRPLADGGGDVRLPIRPDTIDPDLGFDRNTAYRVEARITNRAGISATTSAIFFMRLIAPPINAWLDAERWRGEGSGIGSVDFSNPIELTEICQGENANQRRLSNIHIHNPWSYPIHLSATGSAVVEQYNRKAWVLDRRDVRRDPCLGAEPGRPVGAWRTTGSDARCYDRPEQIPSVVTPSQRVHREFTRVSPVVANNGVALPRDGDNYILAPGQDARLLLQLPICDLPFLPRDEALPRPQPLRVARPHPTERRVLELNQPQPNFIEFFDRYRAIERVSRLRFSISNINLRLYTPIPDGHRVVWHEQWTDSYDIDNPSYRLPEGLEGDD